MLRTFTTTVLRHARTASVVATLGLMTAGSLAAQGQDFSPVKDNTLHEDAGGALSNALSNALRAGRDSGGGGGLIRRAVLAFDLQTIPVGSTVQSATLTLTITGGGGSVFTNDVHCLNADWGEGTSNGGGAGAASTPGDATWIHTFFPGSFWTTPGGDFAPVASASASVGVPGSYAWSSAALTADVQGWVDDPSTNFGWIVIGDESTLQTAKRYGSREDATASNRPVLNVVFDPPCGGSPAALAVRNAGSNPLSLTADPAVVGGVFEATVDNALAGQATSLLFSFETAVTLTLGGGQVLLCLDAGEGELFTGTGLMPSASVAGLDTYFFPIPGNSALCGRVLHAQALQFGLPPFTLSNALDLTLGD